MQKRRFAPSPAMVVALVALFIALGGTSYAALALPNNSVGTKQLKDGAVTGTKIDSSAGGAVKVVGKSGAPAYQSGWHASGGLGDEGVSFYKDAFGVVHLQGSTANGIVGQRRRSASPHKSGVVLTSTIFALPVGYRPKGNLWFAAYGADGTGAYIEITSAGLVQEVFVPQSFIGLSNITFRARL